MYVGRSWESNVFLLDAGTPVTGVLFSAVSVKYRRTGDLTLQTKALVTADWTEVGGGIYILRWSADDLDSQGEFYFQVTGTGFDPHQSVSDIIPAPVEILASPAVCIVFGNIIDLGGQPGVSTSVVFRLAKRPSVADASLVSGALMRTVANAAGNFSVALIRGLYVIVELEDIGLKQQIIVPDQASANILDLLPPISNIPSQYGV